MKKYRKLIVALVGAAAVGVAQALDIDYTEALTLVLSLLTAAGVYIAPNEVPVQPNPNE